MHNSNNSALSKDTIFGAKNHTNINSTFSSPLSLEDFSVAKAKEALNNFIKKCFNTSGEIREEEYPKVVSKWNKSYVWRLRIPFEENNNSRNYISKMLKYEKLLQAENSISNKHEFVSACIQTILKKVPYGIYNITNTGYITTDMLVHKLKNTIARGWNKTMRDILLSTLTGFGCGVVFAAFKLPVPAPPVFAGVAGIIGLWIGFTVLTKIIS